MVSKNGIIARTKRNVEVFGKRVTLPVEAIDVLNVNVKDNEVVITVYENKVVITKAGSKNGKKI